jgi:hypothetical protein
MYFQKNKNLNLYYFLPYLFFLTTSCQSNSSAQKLLIEEEKLVEVLCDVQLAEAMLDTEATEVRDSILKVYYPQILEKHHIQRADFDTTLVRLGQQPMVSSRIFDKVQKKLKELGK